MFEYRIYPTINGRWLAQKRLNYNHPWRSIRRFYNGRPFSYYTRTGAESVCRSDARPSYRTSEYLGRL